jgi:hypothetical protein
MPIILHEKQEAIRDEDCPMHIHLTRLKSATMTSLVAWLLGLLTTRHEVPGSSPGPAVGIFPHRGRSLWWPWSG